MDATVKTRLHTSGAAGAGRAGSTGWSHRGNDKWRAPPTTCFGQGVPIGPAHGGWKHDLVLWRVLELGPQHLDIPYGYTHGIGHGGVLVPLLFSVTMYLTLDWSSFL